MSIKIDFNNMMSENVPQGITDAELTKTAAIANKAKAAVDSSRGLDMLGWTELPYNQTAVVKDINEYVKQIEDFCEYFVVLGIGGSALGAVALYNALKHTYYNELPKAKRKYPRFYCIDDADPERLNALFDIIEPQKTVFNVITKSGATSETMSQYLIVSDYLEQKLGANASKHIVATTSENSGNLIKISKEKGYKTFFIPSSVGGRFSVLSPVGLLPAAAIGIDIAALLDGAKDMDRICKNSDFKNNPALICATLMYLAYHKGANISVMMPYSYGLKTVSDWYCQLWGESLGKAVNRLGEKINVGQTPVKALGVTDQHSQIQLYVEGPSDKVVTFIRVEKFRSEVTIPNGCEAYPDVNFLCGHSLGELTNVEQAATEYALKKAEKMNYTITLDTIDEYNLGSLLYFFQMQTAYIGEFFNINAYNQPGVEEGKNAAYALLGRHGYENKASEISQSGKDIKYIIEI